MQNCSKFNTSPEHTVITRNHFGYFESEPKIAAKVASDLANGFIAGPFCSPPFHNFHSSPLSAVNKPNGDIRIIHDLSYLSCW